MFYPQQIRLGDECTKFFHVMATISYKKNTITQLKDDNGTVITDHASEAAMLLVGFRNRMGISLQPHMAFDLPALIPRNVNLDSLVTPFTKEEIDAIIKLIPLNKAPGSDGFNGMFMRKCWPLIKEDFYILCQDFLSATLILKVSTNPSSHLFVRCPVKKLSMTSGQSLF